MNRIYVLIEGEAGKSHYQLWETINKHIYQNKLDLASCRGCSGVMNKLAEMYNRNDIFIVDIDNVYDNDAVACTLVKVTAYIESLPNVYNLGLLCFEDTMLSFRYLKNWVYSRQERESDRIKQLCYCLDTYREFGIHWIDSPLLVGIVSKMYLQLQRSATENELDRVSTENVAAIVLSAFIMGKNFKITKGAMGVCWLNNCKNNTCIVMRKPNAPAYKFCGLHDLSNAKTGKDKAISLYKNTKLNGAMRECKRYFLSHGFSVARHLVVFDK